MLTGRWSRGLERAIYEIQQEEIPSAILERALRNTKSTDPDLATSFQLCRQVENRLCLEVIQGSLKVQETPAAIGMEVHQLAHA